MNEYSLTLPGLEEAITKSRPDLRHAQLVQALARFPGLQDATLRATRGGDGGIYMQRRKVVRADGCVEHDDHEAWLGEQLHADGGNARATYDRLSQQGYRLSRCDVTRLHLACDRGREDQADFLQIDVDLCDDRVHCALFRGYYFDEPRTLRDLVEFSEGEAVAEDQRTPISLHYQLRRVVDVATFVDLAEQLEEQQRVGLRAREYVVTLGDGPRRRVRMPTSIQDSNASQARPDACSTTGVQAAPAGRGRGCANTGCSNLATGPIRVRRLATSAWFRCGPSPRNWPR